MPSDFTLEHRTPPYRLAVEVGEQTHRDLIYLGDMEELNPTAIVNRAVQFYAAIQRELRLGNQLYVRDPNTATAERWRVI